MRVFAPSDGKQWTLHQWNVTPPSEKGSTFACIWRYNCSARVHLSAVRAGWRNPMAARPRKPMQQWNVLSVKVFTKSVRTLYRWSFVFGVVSKRKLFEDAKSFNSDQSHSRFFYIWFVLWTNGESYTRSDWLLTSVYDNTWFYSCCTVKAMSINNWYLYSIFLLHNQYKQPVNLCDRCWGCSSTWPWGH